MMTTVQKIGKAWWVATDNQPASGPFQLKRDAEIELLIGRAFVDAFRAAVQPRYSSLSMMLYSAADEVRYTQRRLGEELYRLARRAEEDAVRVNTGALPWHSAGQYARSAVEVDVYHAELKAAWQNFSKLSLLALETRDDAAVPVAVSNFFYGGVR